jgi:hypothetical protein
VRSGSSSSLVEMPDDARRGMSRGFRGSSCQAIDGAEVPHDPPVVHRRAVPWPGDRIGVDLQRRVRRADLGPPQLRHAWELRHRRDPPTVRIAESRPLIGPELDRISVLVDIPVVESAYEQGIRKAGLATISPVLDVMAFQEQAIGTASYVARHITGFM